jgi:hypothetical protein
MCLNDERIDMILIQVSQKWRTNYLLPYPGCLNVHEKNMEKIFQTKKLIIIIFIINKDVLVQHYLAMLP